MVAVCVRSVSVYAYLGIQGHEEIRYSFFLSSFPSIFVVVFWNSKIDIHEICYGPKVLHR